MKAIITVVMAVFLLIGWFSFLTAKPAVEEVTVNELDNMKQLAEEWVAEELYQRAAGKYKEILKSEESEETRIALINACKKRYEEESTYLNTYKSELKKAAARYPLNRDFTETLLEIYKESNDTESAYNLICAAEKAGMTDADIIGQKNVYKYAYSLRSNTYEDFSGVSDMYYTVLNNGKYSILKPDGQKYVNYYYPYYVSPTVSKGTAVYGDENGARLISDGIVMGIFSFEVTEAGMYSEGFIPVKNNGSYSYYDEFAKKREGEYDYACAYKNSIAAVSKDGKYYFIDIEGKELTGAFYKISHDKNGVFMNDSKIVAAENKGVFALYDSELKKLCEIAADDADVYKGGLTAFSQGGKWGFFDTEGNVVIQPEYDNAKSFSHGLAAVCKNGKWGFINSENQLAVDFIFSDADYFNSAGYCMVKVVNESEEEITETADIVETEENIETESDAENTDSTGNDEPEKEYWQLLKLELGILD